MFFKFLKDSSLDFFSLRTVYSLALDSSKSFRALSSALSRSLLALSNSLESCSKVFSAFEVLVSSDLCVLVIWVSLYSRPSASDSIFLFLCTSSWSFLFTSC